ncbi:DUF4258 domain-containing protein [Peptococcaceae bacterium 1198_IL3148]
MKKRNPKPKDERITFLKIKIAKQKPFVILSHARQRMSERNISYRDITNILNRGYKLDRHDSGKLGDPTVRIIGKKVTGEWAAIAIAINPKGKIVVLTVMDDNRQKN